MIVDILSKTNDNESFKELKVTYERLERTSFKNYFKNYTLSHAPGSHVPVKLMKKDKNTNNAAGTLAVIRYDKLFPLLQSKHQSNGICQRGYGHGHEKIFNDLRKTWFISRPVCLAFQKSCPGCNGIDGNKDAQEDEDSSSEDDGSSEGDSEQDENNEVEIGAPGAVGRSVPITHIGRIPIMVPPAHVPKRITRSQDEPVSKRSRSSRKDM